MTVYKRSLNYSVTHTDIQCGNRGWKCVLMNIFIEYIFSPKSLVNKKKKILHGVLKLSIQSRSSHLRCGSVMCVCQGRPVGGAAGSEGSNSRPSCTHTQTDGQTDREALSSSSNSFSHLFTDATNTLPLVSEPWRPGPPVDCRCSSSFCWDVAGCPPSTWTWTTSCGSRAIPAACSASPWPCTGSCDRRTRECKRRSSCLLVRAEPCAPRKHAKNALFVDIKP